MGTTTDLRREVKTRFIPLAVQRGFSVEQEEMPNALRFRRTVNGSTQVFELRWEKYGKPRFAIHFGTCPASGLSIRGQRIEPATALPGWLPDSGSLQPGPGASSGSWFRQDLPLFKRLFAKSSLLPPSAVIDQLLELFPELESYWENGAVGPHIRMWGMHQADPVA